MTYTLDVSITAGPAATGRTDWTAQLVNSDGSLNGAPVTTGFHEIGGGNYLWHYTSWPSGFRGGVRFQSATSPALDLFAAVNPSDGENLDAKISTRATLGAGGISHTHTVTDVTTGDPIDGVAVWVTSTNDPNGSLVAAGYTNSSGQITFLVDPGTYYVWEQRAGFAFTGPTTFAE